MNGFFNIYKPSGITSRDAVNIVKRILPRKTKIGHAGTLDPLAEGVLVVAVGSSTRLIEYAQQGKKTYLADFLLGSTSNTEDTEGEIIELPNPPVPTAEQLQQAADQWTGLIEQVPPVFSALKINGVPAYKRARAGEELEMASRKITIYSAKLIEYQYPKMKWELICSSGTYVRSWGRDVAKTLESGAIMSGLVRTKVGNFSLEEAVKPEQLNAGNLESFLLSPLTGLSEMESVVLSESQIYDLRLGRFIAHSFSSRSPSPWAGLDLQGELKAILLERPDGSIQALKNLE